MPSMGFVASFDVLAWGVVVGSSLLLGGLLWVLLVDRPIQERLQAKKETEPAAPVAPRGAGDPESPPTPGGPRAPKAPRAA